MTLFTLQECIHAVQDFILGGGIIFLGACVSYTVSTTVWWAMQGTYHALKAYFQG